jgi:hypothetical protein
MIQYQKIRAAEVRHALSLLSSCIIRSSVLLSLFVFMIG